MGSSDDKLNDFLASLPKGDQVIKENRSPTKAVEQFWDRRLEEYEESAHHLLALESTMEQCGVDVKTRQVVGRAALLITETYIARREGACLKG